MIFAYDTANPLEEEGLFSPKVVALWFSFIQLKVEEDSLADFQGAGQHQCHNRRDLETERSPEELDVCEWSGGAQGPVPNGCLLPELTNTDKKLHS